MIKITLGQIVDSFEALKKIAQCKFSGLSLLNIYKLLKVCESENVEFEKVRLAKYKEYGEEVETNQFKLKQENITVFVTEIEAVRAKEIELNFDKIKHDDLVKIDCEPAVLLSIPWLIEDAEVKA